MTDESDKNNVNQNVIDDNNGKKELWSYWGQTSYRALFVFFLKVSHPYNVIWLLLKNSHVSKNVKVQLFCREIGLVQEDIFYPHQGYRQVDFYKESVLYIIGRTIRDLKTTNFSTIGSKLVPFSQKLTNVSFFVNTPRHFMIFFKKYIYFPVC